jgi:hypothetical protein
MRIAEAAFEWGAEVALTSAKHQSGSDRAAEVLRKAAEFTHVVNIQGDDRLRRPKLIDRLVTRMERDRSIEMITAAHPFPDDKEAASPHQVKVVVARDGTALYFSRSIIPFRRDEAQPSPTSGTRASTATRAICSCVCPLETVAARACGIAGAIARAREWSKNSRARHEDRFAGRRHPEDAAAVEQILASRGTEGTSLMKYISSRAAS